MEQFRVGRRPEFDKRPTAFQKFRRGKAVRVKWFSAPVCAVAQLGEMRCFACKPRLLLQQVD